VGEVVVIVAQTLLLSMAVVIMALIVRRYQQRGLRATAFVLWFLLWVAAAWVILFPDSTMVLARLLGIGRGADLVL
jgi:hypothetical protein